ncbi:phage tail protein [Enterobacter cloacae]|uniref:phage tail protein n=1 Tax=Enterobacter cloacae TaxID=550 RepID=UPI0020760168|nr:phage tail protein [Enterobacter cloacae]MCM7406392.1 phage tail protein [Enterobacter cloacae]
MSAKFYTLLTEIGAAKLASAAALGVPLKITQMAVGDGDGVLPTPSAQQTRLIAEKRRADLNMLYIDPQNSSQIIAEQVIPETEGGWWIREVGLFDETGALIAVGNCPESYKPQLAEGSGRTQTVRMVLITSSTDTITLKIDPAVVLATRKYVDDKVLELKVYVDDLMAKHIAAADPHIQYASKESPTLTGTPKAPTAPAGTNTTQIASTAFVQAVVTALNNALALKAPLVSPSLTGTPTAPTATQTANNTQVATTAFVKAAIAALVASSPAALDTLNELAAALGNDPNFATTMTNALAGKQPLDNTLTALSGKSVAELLVYLGLSELAKTQRYMLSKGSNASGWYEIYSDGLIRQGMKFPNDAPLTISTPAAGAAVPFPVSFKSTIISVNLALNAGVDNGLEFPGYTSESLSSIRVLSMAVTNTANATGSYLSKFVGYIVVEGY